MRNGRQCSGMSNILIKIFSCLLFCVLTVCSFSAYAETMKGTVSIIAENDLFHSDRYYTNGVRASYITAPCYAPDWALKAAEKLPFFHQSATIRASYSIGQNMYTPEDIELSNPPENDRPYAGWLYGSVGLISETGKRLEQIELNVGMVGSLSYAEETQKAVHELIGSPEPLGWDYQLKNEIGVNLLYQSSWRSYVSKSLLGIPFDFTPDYSFSVGNVFAYAAAGFIVRYGIIHDDDYGPPRIQPSMPGSGFFSINGKFRFYLFAGLEGRLVGRNIFLDGNTFENSRSVDKEPLVGDFQYGGVLTYDIYRLSYTHIIRSTEFHDQAGVRQDFSAVTFSVQF